jgi:thiamine pyrophosphate-dependent acetolactate synthase large subunit-like protein
VLNNFSLGWIKFGQKRRGDRFISADFHVQPDFIKIAEANECYGERVEVPGDIKPALERALKANEDGQTTVLEFIVDGWDFAPGFESFYHRLS